MDEQKQLLQGLWRKAFSQQEPLEIPCKTGSNATRLRFALYNSVRAVREGKKQADTALKNAVENCAIGFHPQDKTILVIQQKVMTELMQTIASIVGNDPQASKTDDEIAMEASQAKLMEVLGSPQADDSPLGLPRSTPYYTR